MWFNCCSQFQPCLALFFPYPLWASLSKQLPVPWTCCLFFGILPVILFPCCAWVWQNALLVQLFIPPIIHTSSMGRVKLLSWLDYFLSSIVCGWKWWCLNLGPQEDFRFLPALWCLCITMSRISPGWLMPLQPGIQNEPNWNLPELQSEKETKASWIRTLKQCCPGKPRLLQLTSWLSRQCVDTWTTISSCYLKPLSFDVAHYTKLVDMLTNAALSFRS